MHHLELLTTLTSALVAALICGYITQRGGLSPIVGYLLAGVVIGPTTPGIAANRELAGEMAEIGVILLMFGVGLHFHWEELYAVRRVAVPGAIGQSLVATVLGALLALAVGWGWSTGLVFGLALSVASTVVLTRVLSDHNDLHTPAGHVAVGWLIVEDLLTVVMLVVLPTMFPLNAAENTNLSVALTLAVVKIGLLVGFTFFVGGRVIPWLLKHVAATRSRELFTLTVLVIALGIAVGSAQFFGVSMALGAFLAGMVVGRSDFSLRAASEALPMRDAFAVLFFVSVGMLLDPAALVEEPGTIAATLAVVLIGKPLAAVLIVSWMGYPVRTSLSVAIALAQIGEFSFMLASLGKERGIMPDRASHALVIASMISISLNPILYRCVRPMERWAATQPWLWRWLTAKMPKVSTVDQTDDGGESDKEHRAVVIGYGPVGRTVTRLLSRNGVTPIILEMNLETVRRLRAEGIHAIYGDAGHRDTMLQAGIADAATLVISAGGLHGVEEMIRTARELNPRIRILARATYLYERPQWYAAGANHVFAAEGEVALAMAESILVELGATAEQIDRERERQRADLSEALPPVRLSSASSTTVGQAVPDASATVPQTEEKSGTA
ncbi:MAG TPA: cation:proton antiporter [Planctomycetaceae bacterium]|nr:cation:proton antiporter [Planctomycetaceae bacterium]